MIHSTSFDFFCLLFIFSVSTQRQHRIQAPLRSHLTHSSNLSSFFQELPSFPPSPLSALVSTLGALACAACVWACVCVYLVCSASECACVCVGVKASLCMLAGIGSNPGVPFTHLLWNQQSGFQAPFLHPPNSASAPLSLPPLQVLHGPLLPTLTLQRKHGFHTAKKEQGCKLSSPSPVVYIYVN